MQSVAADEQKRALEKARGQVLFLGFMGWR